jgi:hypothetical protein
MKHAILDIISVHSNPVRFETRTRLSREFQHYVGKEPHCRFWQVEIAFGDRPFEVTDPNNPFHIQLRSATELWHKENMINIAVSRLPLDSEYVAWIDADIRFVRPDWVLETIQQLQHYKVVQMFSVARDMSPNHESFQIHKGFAYSYDLQLKSNDGYEFWHPGYAWAIRRHTLDELGGLMDFPILGAADHHMAWAFIGNAIRSLPGHINKNYFDLVMDWQDNAVRLLRKNIGYVPGEIHHYWHGKKKDRKYQERWEILTKYNFDPVRDLKKDGQGLWQLRDHGTQRDIMLRDSIRHYFRQRNEDSIDME